MRYHKLSIVEKCQYFIHCSKKATHKILSRNSMDDGNSVIGFYCKEHTDRELYKLNKQDAMIK